MTYVFTENSDVPYQTNDDAITREGIPKTSTPAKKNGAEKEMSPQMQRSPEPDRKADGHVTETGSPMGGGVGGAVGGAYSGAKGEPACGEETPVPGPPHGQPSPNVSKPNQIYPVPEPIAEISSIHDTSSDGDVLRNPEPRRKSDPTTPMEFSSLPSPESLVTMMSSFQQAADKFDKLRRGYHSQCVRRNLQHSKSVENIRSLTNSVSSQQEDIEEIRTLIGYLMRDMADLKSRLGASGKRPEVAMHCSRNTFASSSTHSIPYDSEREQGHQSFILPSTDLNIRAELFLVGYDTGQGTHLSLRIEAKSGNAKETGQLPSQCRFEIRILNFDDEDETRKKSKDSNSKENDGGMHVVEFPKVIEKDVVENEALGFKKNGMLRVTLIVSWEEINGE
ncbi:uncharacterized protein LOC121421393 isoform X2 [Lytechinus variegatus]|uniref:uncharacterized protein LOC121421393 isoform X2 n=1 Tax=Lytechinus variegatus TaxID=7654 RepID=UPI001BB138A6|nr:uncharacterized protein LOC121421393 isoform X2 [Lytechinus variegatus]